MKYSFLMQYVNWFAFSRSTEKSNSFLIYCPGNYKNVPPARKFPMRGAKISLSDWQRGLATEQIKDLISITVDNCPRGSGWKGITSPTLTFIFNLLVDTPREYYNWADHTATDHSTGLIPQTVFTSITNIRLTLRARQVRILGQTHSLF